MQLGRLVLRKSQHRLANGTNEPENRMDIPGIGQVPDQPLPAGRIHGLHADHRPPAAVARPLLKTLGSDREVPVVLVPDGQRQRRQPLEIFLAQNLLAPDIYLLPEFG